MFSKLYRIWLEQFWPNVWTDFYFHALVNISTSIHWSKNNLEINITKLDSIEITDWSKILNNIYFATVFGVLTTRYALEKENIHW